jgi:DNA-binding transcriptional LysR family regulator
MFELRRLRLLHELALRGTIAEVAASLSYSPSTVSQQLNLLEREAGVALLEPDGRRVRLTPQGRMLAQHAARALELDEAARAALATHAGWETVRLSAMPTAAETIVPAALTALADRAPQLRVELAELPPEESLFELWARRFDLVIAEQYPGHAAPRLAELDREPLVEDEIRLGAQDPAVGGVTDAAGAAWVMEPRGTASRHWAEQTCRLAGFEPDVRFETADLQAHIRLVESGHAVALLPDLVWGGQAPSVRVVDLPGGPRREVFTSARRAGSADATIAACRDVLARAVELLGLG